MLRVDARDEGPVVAVRLLLIGDLVPVPLLELREGQVLAARLP
jgi:hypothetical protein